jgi:hypothetical protein
VESCGKESSLELLLTNDFLNNFINFPFDVGNDDTLALLVSLLKTVANKLNPRLAQYLRLQLHGDCPIYSVAFDYYWHIDPFVRVTCQTTILSLFKFGTDDLKMYMLQQRGFFECSFNHIVQEISTLNESITDIKLSRVTEELDFMNDFFSLSCKIVHEYLTNGFMDILIVPCIFQLITEKGPAKRIGMYFLNFLLANLRSSTLNQIIVEMFTELQEDGVPLFLVMLDNEIDELLLVYGLGFVFLVLNDELLNNNFRSKWSSSGEDNQSSSLGTSKLTLERIIDRCIIVLSSASSTYSLLTFMVCAAVIETLLVPIIPHYLLQRESRNCAVLHSN